MAPALHLTLSAAAVLVVAVSGCGSSGGHGSTASGAQTAPTAGGTGSTAGTPGAVAGTVKVTETEYKIAPAPATARAGKVTFDVTNAGAIPHELVVIRTDKAASALLRGTGADATGTVGKLGEKALGVRARGSLTLDLKAGHYALICNLPGHYQGGMHADFTVT